ASGASGAGARAQYGMAAAPDGTLYSYGGASAAGGALDDLWALPHSGRWQRLGPASKDAPPPLIEPHLVVDNAGRVYELGGILEDGSHLNRLFRFDPREDRK